MKQMSLGESGFERLGLEDAQARIPGRDEPGGALGRVGLADRATCTGPWRQGRTPTVETMLFALSSLWMVRRTLQRELLSPFSADERRVLGESIDRLQQSATRLRAAAGTDLAGEEDA